MSKNRFVWHDLSTTDVEGAKRFYGEIFNWKFDGEPSYQHIKAGDEMIGGIRKLGADEKQPPAWLGYVVVDDVAKTVESIKGAGGNVYVPTQVMENVGTFAVTADPTGAVFAPWKSARPGEDVEKTTAPGPFTFVWDELMSTDPDKAGAFYAKVFGWQAKPMDMGGGMIYSLLERPGTKNPFREGPNAAGGMMKSPMGVSFWLAYVGVDDCDKRCAQAERLGGKIMVPAQDIPNVGRFACWSDPQGAAIAELQPKM
jgi:predicted enzyme related to lactoylglutathione lyase